MEKLQSDHRGYRTQYRQAAVKNAGIIGLAVGRIAVFAIAFVFTCTCLAADKKDKFVKYRKLQGYRVEVFRIGGNMVDNPAKKEIRQMQQMLDDCYGQLNKNVDIAGTLSDVENLYEKVLQYIPKTAVYYKDEIEMLYLWNESMHPEESKDSIAWSMPEDTVRKRLESQVVQSYARAFEEAEQLSVQSVDTVSSETVTGKDSVDTAADDEISGGEIVDTASESPAETVSPEGEDEQTGGSVDAVILLFIIGLAIIGYYIYCRIEFYNIIYYVLGDEAVRMVKRKCVWQGMPECLLRLQRGKEDDVTEVRRPGEIRRIYYYRPIEGARKNARKKYYSEYHFVNGELVTWEIIKKKAK